MSRSKNPVAADLQPFVPVAEAIALLLKPHAEVVLHDLATDRIVHIANAYSGRVPGDPSLHEADGIVAFDRAVIGPYRKRNFDGRPLKSVSAVLPDATGKPVGLLCINIDVTMFETLAELARGFLDAGDARPSVLFEADWREEANAIVGDYLWAQKTTLARLSAAQRVELVESIEARGLFEMRNAAAHLSQILGISRATLYATLKTVRDRRSAGDAGTGATP